MHAQALCHGHSVEFICLVRQLGASHNQMSNGRSPLTFAESVQTGRVRVPICGWKDLEFEPNRVSRLAPATLMHCSSREFEYHMKPMNPAL
jgi:hypothetical protein